MIDDGILIAKEGMTYTNGTVFRDKIWLGVNDSPENWYEITKEEAEERKKIQEELNDIFSMID